jgi:hypothetical protein
MPASNPSASAAAGSQPPDVTQLVALLGSLMPLLLRFQSQGFQSQAFQWQIPEAPFQAGLGNVMIPDPTLDHQAAVSLVGDIVADSLRNLSAYLEVHAGRHHGLESCVPIVTQAARSFAAHDYAQAFNLIWQAYRMIAMIRAGDPQLPPLRPVGQVSSDQSSIH